MCSKDFELYYYNDSKLSPVAAHTHNYYEFYFFLEGNIQINIKDYFYRIKPGDFVIIPAGIVHYPEIMDTTVPYRRFVLWISKEYFESLTHISEDYAYLIHYVQNNQKYVFHTDRIHFNTIQSMIYCLIEETKTNRFGKEPEITLQLNSLLLYLNRFFYEKLHTHSKVSDALYLSVCRYIAENLEENLSLEKLSEAFFVSKFYISHSFKENMGITVHQYIIKKRLDACKKAMITTNSISEVYSTYGFRDYSAFYRAFRKEYGISPKQYKETVNSILDY